MKILFINRVYPPSNGATGELLAELAAALNQKGVSVTVLTSGKKSETPGASAAREPQFSTAQTPAQTTVHRVAGLPFTRSSHWKRALSYCSLYPAFLWRALRLPRHDTLVTLTDPPLHLLLGPVIRFFKGGQLVHWAQDVYPELAGELGVLRRNSFALRILRFLSTWALRRHDHIIAVGRCMKERLIERGIAPEKIVVVPNWAQSEPRENSNNANNSENAFRRSVQTDQNDHSSSSPREEGVGRGSRRGAAFEKETSSPHEPGHLLSPSLSSIGNGGEGNEALGGTQLQCANQGAAESSTAFRRRHGLDGKFVIMYSGNFGLAHTFESIVFAARELEKTLPQVQFVFVGDGPRLASLKEQLNGCGNVMFLPFQPKETLADSLSAAHVHIASMRDELCGLVVPSKVYGILDAARPCIFIGPKESETARLIVEHNCGWVTAPADHSALVQIFKCAAQNPSQLKEMGGRARIAAQRQDINKAAEEFQQIFSGNAPK